MGILKLLLMLLFLSTFASLAFSGTMTIAKKGASLLFESGECWFPLMRLLYFYNGLAELEKAVRADPSNLKIRFIRASALFEFRNIDFIRNTCKNDLEFILMYNDNKCSFIDKRFNIIYYMLCVLSIEGEDLNEAKFYFKELNKLKTASSYLKLLKINYPRLISKIEYNEK